MNLTIDARMIKSSGIGRYIENILKRIIPMESDWMFYLLGNIEELENFNLNQYSNVKCIQCTAPIYSIREQFELIYKIPKSTDLFWSPHYNIPILYRGKLLVTVHDVLHLARPEFVKGIHRRLYAKMMFYFLVKKADKIICDSEFTASELKKYTHIDCGKICVIHIGVDEEWFHITKGEAVHKRPYLLYVGNIKPHKNLCRLLEAYKKIYKEIPHDLILVGKKEGFITGDKSVAELAEKLGSRVIFTGYVDDEKLKQYFKQADLFIFPSLYEGFGLPPLEAIASGCPVVASNAASIPEVCGDIVTYFDPYDENDIGRKILLNLRASKENKEVIQKKIIKCKKYMWDVVRERVSREIKMMLSLRSL